MEAEKYCEVADKLGIVSKLLKALRGIVSDCSKPLTPDPKGDLIYVVPWVDGPNGFSRPFGLDTKYGHLVFAFQNKGDLYDAFFGASAADLKPGYSLKTAAVLVPRRDAWDLNWLPRCRLEWPF